METVPYTLDVGREWGELGLIVHFLQGLNCKVWEFSLLGAGRKRTSGKRDPGWHWK